MLTRDQRYAAKILQQVQAVPDNQKKDYGIMAHKLPILIRTAGLAQALTFVESKGKYSLLLAHIAEVTLGTDRRDTLLNRSKGENQESLSDYLRLTQQVMAALLWYKRFAQSVLKVDPTEDNDSVATPPPAGAPPAVPTGGAI